MLELRKVSRPVEAREHICLPCYWCWPIVVCSPMFFFTAW